MNSEDITKIRKILEYRKREDLSELLSHSESKLDISSTFGSKYHSLLTSFEIYSPLRYKEKLEKLPEKEKKTILNAVREIYPVKDNSPEVVKIEFFSDYAMERADPDYLAEEFKYEKNDIFVIYGRNLQIRDSIYKFLGKLGLHPVSFEEAKQKTGKGAPYILEILNQAISNEIPIISLLTPDDIGYLNPYFHKNTDKENEKQPMGQSRQNVIFETGMAFAKNPRWNKCLLNPPSPSV